MVAAQRFEQRELLFHDARIAARHRAGKRIDEPFVASGFDRAGEHGQDGAQRIVFVETELAPQGDALREAAQCEARRIVRGGVVQHAAARRDRERMAAERAGEVREGVLETTIRLDGDRAAGDARQVCEISGEQVEWVKTTGCSALVASG